MGRILFRKIVCWIFVGQAFNVFAASIVFDANNAAVLSEILKNTITQVNKLENLKIGLNKIYDQMGCSPHRHASIINWLGLSNYRQARHVDLYQETAAGFLLKKLGGLDHLEHENLHKLLAQHLFIEPSNSITFSNYDRVKEDRQNIFKKSMQMSLELATQQQIEIEAAKKELQELFASAVRSNTIHDDLVHISRLLGLVSKELIETRKLLAKQMELQASQLIANSGINLGIDNMQGTK